MTFALVKSEKGSSAAEFALVLPLLVLILFGIIDVGRYAWEYNRAEKATQMGARFAAVTGPVAPGLFAYKFTASGVAAGDPIPNTAIGTINCVSATCTCTGACPTGTGTPTGAWTQLVARMVQIDPNLTAANIRVQYRDSGLGFAGDPTGMDAVPMITVSVSNLAFRPLSFLMLTHTTMPDFATTLTAEDSVGAQSN